MYLCDFFGGKEGETIKKKIIAYNATNACLAKVNFVHIYMKLFHAPFLNRCSDNFPTIERQQLLQAMKWIYEALFSCNTRYCLSIEMKNQYLAQRE